MFIFLGVQVPISTNRACQAFCPLRSLGSLNFCCLAGPVAQALHDWFWRNVGLGVPDPHANRLERTFFQMAFLATHACRQDNALPTDLPSQPLEEELRGGWESCGAQGRPSPVDSSPAMDTRTDRVLTVRASITSWKFLFPMILFFIARKASLGLGEGQ